jgi:hypothetical protein
MMPGSDLTAARAPGSTLKPAGDGDLGLARREVEHDGDAAAAVGEVRALPSLKSVIAREAGGFRA